ncbi:hypothetical protein L6R53_17570 [Myxococcota bacterium]|nr:hypothetical protein [Myxococcota bacterium]
MTGPPAGPLAWGPTLDFDAASVVDCSVRSCAACEYFPDLWQDHGGSCQLRDPDDYEAVIQCMQACISMGDSPDEILETSGSGPDGGDGDGQGEWQW